MIETCHISDRPVSSLRITIFPCILVTKHTIPVHLILSLFISTHHTSYQLQIHLLFFRQSLQSKILTTYVDSTSVRQSVCHSVSDTNQFVRFSWNLGLESCTKRISSKRAFLEKRLCAIRTLLKVVNEFLLETIIILDVFLWTLY